MNKIVLCAMVFASLATPTRSDEKNYGKDYEPLFPLERNGYADHVTVNCPYGRRLMISPAQHDSAAYLFCGEAGVGYTLKSRD